MASRVAWPLVPPVRVSRLPMGLDLLPALPAAAERLKPALPAADGTCPPCLASWTGPWPAESPWPPSDTI
eukprot:4026787-Pyramimonas_sp.AAC.1